MQAAGFVVYRKMEGAIQYLLLQTSWGRHHWTPPKGFLDRGEIPLEAAKRETREESGLVESDLDVDKDFKQVITYFDPSKNRNKEVHYWLARLKVPQQKITLSREHQEFKWFELEEACRHVEFIDLGDILRAAQEHIVKNCTSASQ